MCVSFAFCLKHLGLRLGRDWGGRVGGRGVPQVRRARQTASPVHLYTKCSYHVLLHPV